MRRITPFELLKNTIRMSADRIRLSADAIRKPANSLIVSTNRLMRFLCVEGQGSGFLIVRIGSPCVLLVRSIARWISSHSQRVSFTLFLDSIRMFREGIKKSIRQKRASQEDWLLANGRIGKGMGEYALKVSSAWVVRPTSCSIYRPTSNRGRVPQRGCSTSVLDSVRWSQPSTAPKALALP